MDRVSATQAGPDGNAQTARHGENRGLELRMSDEKQPPVNDLNHGPDKAVAGQDAERTERRNGTAALRTRRHWMFRLAALAIGMAPFLMMECGLRLVDWRPPAPQTDPFVGFKSIKPLFTLSPGGTHYSVPEYRREFFEPESFLKAKPDGGFRIFCLGGSTVQGRPYSIASSFTTWLEIALQAADPNRHWEVVNCGGVSYASYRLAPILEECLGYEPDLIVICTGHNEFLEDRSYRGIKEASGVAIAIQQVAAKSRLAQWAASWRRTEATGSTVLPQEVDALLDYRGGLASYHRDPAWRRQVVEHYAWNLRRMIALARERDVPVVLVAPVSNLRDCPPFKVEDAPSLDSDSRRRFQQTWMEARRVGAQEPQDAIPLLQEALRIDPEHAAAWYLLGQSYLADQQYAKASPALQAALDYDVCPLRMTAPLRAALRQVAESTGTPLIDAHAHFASKAEHSLVGDRELEDHIHPKIPGHQEIADLLFTHCVREGMVMPGADFESRRGEAYRRHWAESLDEAYVGRGRQRLEGLRRWASGRAFKVRPPEEAR